MAHEFFVHRLEKSVGDFEFTLKGAELSLGSGRTVRTEDSDRPTGFGNDDLFTSSNHSQYGRELGFRLVNVELFHTSKIDLVQGLVNLEAVLRFFQ